MNQTRAGGGPARGRFLVLEGLDGSGKSTQALRLSARLRSLGFPVYDTREPTDGPVGSLIRQILTGRCDADQRTIAALFAADRLDHLLNRVDGLAEKAAGGISIVCDRYYFSSYAYHSVHVPLEWIIQANSLSAGILRPDLTLFLDLAPEKCLARLRGDRWHLELYENLENMRNVRERYLAAFDRLREAEKIRIVDADQDAERVAQDIWTAVAPLFGSS